jgi:NO-binding membrane sensor protein with MHYT domain
MIVSYDIKLVLLSLAVAILGAHTGLAVMARSSGSKSVPYKLRIAAAAVAIGGGIWAMHFIGMLALHLPIPIDYAVLPTLISLLIAVVITGLGLYSATSGHLGAWAILVGGVLMGCGIASMHYVGMEAIRAACVVTYSYSGVLASIVVGISASWLALWFIVRSQGHHDIVLGAVFLGLAISAMHYVGMLSTRFAFAEGSVLFSEPVLDHSYLACVVAVLTFLFCDAFLLLILPNAKRNRNFSDIETGELSSATSGGTGSLFGPQTRAQHPAPSLTTPFAALNTKGVQFNPVVARQSSEFSGLGGTCVPRAATSDQIRTADHSTQTGPAGFSSDELPYASRDPEGLTDQSVQVLSSATGNRPSLAVHTKQGIWFVEVENVVFVCAEGHYTQIGFENEAGIFQQQLCDRPISRLCRELCALGFLQVHRSYLANPKYISGYARKGDGGELLFALAGAPRIPVSRARYREVRAQIESCLGVL